MAMNWFEPDTDSGFMPFRGRRRPLFRPPMPTQRRPWDEAEAQQITGFPTITPGMFFGGDQPEEENPEQVAPSPVSDNQTTETTYPFPKMKALQNMEPEPQQSDFPVSKKRLIAALALGALSGFMPGAVQAGVPYETASGIMEAPYRRAVTGYGKRRKRAVEEAEVERQRTQAERGVAEEERAKAEEGRRASKSTREEQEAGFEKKRKVGTPVRSYRKSVGGEPHMIDVFVDENGQEREVDRGVEAAPPRTDMTMSDMEVYMKAAGGDAAKALQMRNADLARIAGIKTGGVDDRKRQQVKTQAEIKKQNDLKQAEDDFRNPQKRGFYQKADVLSQRKQQIQDAYEGTLAAGENEVAPFRYDQQNATARPAVKPSQPAAVPKAGGKVASIAQVREYAEKYGMTEEQAKKAFQDDGFTVQ